MVKTFSSPSVNTGIEFATHRLASDRDGILVA
jgi:hypothetical protein